MLIARKDLRTLVAGNFSRLRGNGRAAAELKNSGSPDMPRKDLRTLVAGNFSRLRGNGRAAAELN